jgi:hypothetical protein
LHAILSLEILQTVSSQNVFKLKQWSLCYLIGICLIAESVSYILGLPNSGKEVKYELEVEA